MCSLRSGDVAVTAAYSRAQFLLRANNNTGKMTLSYKPRNFIETTYQILVTYFSVCFIFF